MVQLLLTPAALDQQHVFCSHCVVPLNANLVVMTKCRLAMSAAAANGTIAGAPCEYDSIVIGGGIMGATTAYYLAKDKKQRVLLIEQFRFLHNRGSSNGRYSLQRVCDCSISD